MKPLAIIEEPIVSASLDRARKKYPKFDSYWERGLSWHLSRTPKTGKPVPDHNPPRYAWGINPWRPGGIPRIVIVYRHLVDEDKILLERVTFHE